MFCFHFNMFSPSAQPSDILSPWNDKEQYLFIGLAGKSNSVAMASALRETQRAARTKTMEALPVQ